MDCVNSSVDKGWATSDEVQPLVSRKTSLNVLQKRYLSARKCFGSPGIVTILAISFLVQMMYHFFSNASHLLPYYVANLAQSVNVGMHHPDLVQNVVRQTCTTGLFMVYPLAGYLADVKFGHYKIILISLRAAVLSLFIVLIGAGFLVTAFIIMPERSTTHTVLTVLGALSFPVGLILLLLAVVGVNANIVQLGLDQLFDSPWDDQVVFIYWYMWVAFSARLVVIAFNMVYCDTSSQLVYYVTASVAFFVILLALATLLFLATLKRRWFITNYYKSRENPYRLVYQATKYAWQEKALFRCMCLRNDHPSGLDVGRLRVGGPFTAEQIQDVRSFYGIMKVLLVSGVFFYFAHVTYSMNEMLSFQINSELEANITSMVSNNSTVNVCHQSVKESVVKILLPKVIIVVLIPCKILFIRPFVIPHLPSMLKTIGIMLALTLLPMVTSFIINSVTHYENKSLQCLFDLPNAESTKVVLPLAHHVAKYFDIYNTLTLAFMDCLAVVMYVNLYKFICSQSPHSTKGFLVGLAFAVWGFYDLAHPLLAMAFGYAWSSNFNPQFPSCGMVYYIINICLVLVAVVIYYIIACKYQYRRRDIQPSNMEDHCAKVHNRLSNYGICNE